MPHLSRSAGGKAAARLPSGGADASHQELMDSPADLLDPRRTVRSHRVSGMSGHTHQGGVRDVRGRLDRILYGIVKVQFGNQQQNGRADRAQRGGGVAAKPRRGADVMRVARTALDGLKRLWEDTTIYNGDSTITPDVFVIVGGQSIDLSGVNSIDQADGLRKTPGLCCFSF